MKQKEQISTYFKGIIDSTLREGLQFSRAEFSLKDMQVIFRFLSDIGVDYVEVGNPASDEIRRMICGLVSSRPASCPKILSHIRNHEGDLEKAIASGAEGVNILCSVDAERLAAMGISRYRYLDRLIKNIELAREHNLEVRVGVEAFFNFPLSLSTEIYALAEEYRVHRIGLADTLGNKMGWEVLHRVRDLRRRFNLDFEVHFHNDLGHAVSNAVIALVAGANWISTSLLGIGERTGITPLSSLLVNLYLLDPDLVKNYNLSLLTPAENYVSHICRMETPVNLITNTLNGFAHKAGIHLDALVKFGPEKYELLPPMLIGNKRHLVIDSLISGRARKKDLAAFIKEFRQ